MRFIDEHKGVFGVEPICRVLTQHGAPIAPSTYYAAKVRPPSARAVRDARLRAEITRVWKENREVYGADKVWLELNRQGVPVARCTTERLMRQLGLQGVRRGKKIRTTTAGRDGQRAGDLLNRDFTAPAPNRRWVAGFTYVATWAGSSTSRSSSTSTHGPSWAGRPPPTSAPSWCWTHSRWRCGGAATTATRPGRA